MGGVKLQSRPEFTSVLAGTSESLILRKGGTWNKSFPLAFLYLRG